jgi:hypothetical protein
MASTSSDHGVARRRRPLLVLWSMLGGFYTAFLVWYGGFGSPLTRPEIEVLLERYAEVPWVASEPDLLDQIRVFAEADDGREVVVFNWVAQRPGSDGGAIGGTGESPDAGRRMAWLLFSRAGHPIGSARVGFALPQPKATLPTELSWVRWRSRRDLLEALATPVFHEHATRNVHTLDEAFKIVTVPGAAFFVGPRGIMGFLLVSLGALGSWVIEGRGRT